MFIHLWRSWRSVIAAVSLSMEVGVPDLLLGREHGLEPGFEPGFEVEATSVVDDEGMTCNGMARFAAIPVE
jgi:hypothetical protein